MIAGFRLLVSIALRPAVHEELMTQHIPDAAFWCALVVALALLVLLLRQRRIAATLRRRAATLEDGIRNRDEEARHLVDVRLPSVADAYYQAEPPPGLHDAQLAGTSFADSLERVLDHFTGAVDKARARADQSAKAALKASMRALQGLANEQQMSISDMQERHDNPDVLHDLLQIDHTNSQFGRRAQAIAVLCGSWPGRQRAASPLVDVARGATSRIRDYRRVRVHAQVDMAVVSRAVEPAVLAVAELLDNAARHSQPNTTVEVNIQPAHNGTSIVIDDAGVGMDPQEVERATYLLSGTHNVDVARLGDPPQFGFAVVGVLAARYGFTVSADTRSPYGGVRAVIFVPSELLTHLDQDGEVIVPATPARGSSPEPVETPPVRRRPQASGHTHAPPEPPAPAPHPVAPGPPPPPPGAPLPGEPVSAGPETDHTPQAPAFGATAGGLPKRRRRQQINDWPGEGGATPAAPQADSPSARPAEETARRMGAFARGTRSGRAAGSSGPHAGTYDEGGNTQS